MNILQALKKSTNFVEQVTNQSQSESKIEAEHIFMYVLQVNRSKLYEWLLDNDCPFEWDVDEKSSNNETVKLIFSEKDND